ncbi:recombinase family protein [Brevibacillus daliensis]|uniref:recombinase family protein n=1 Tax=Brevibacillus daliensis TaxID=2892995 RepID=UPI001E59CB35|nr:recombinase family protein [Brevibacillus daliensis]
MVAIYARTGTHDTEAIQRQISKCIYDVKDGDLIIFSDCGVSDLSVNKPRLNLLIEKAKYGELKKVIVADHSHFSRKPQEVANIVSQLHETGVEVVFVEGK